MAREQSPLPVLLGGDVCKGSNVKEISNIQRRQEEIEEVQEAEAKTMDTETLRFRMHNVSKLLDEDTETLREQLHPLYEALAKEHNDEAGNVIDESGLDLEGLRQLTLKVEEIFGIPDETFGDLADTYQRFDFNGNGILDFNESFKCVRRCMFHYREIMGFGKPIKVMHKTPEEGGYTTVKVLASGGQGKAILVTDKKGDEVVLKTYDKTNENAGGLDELIDESKMMRRVDSPFVAKCIELFQDSSFLYMVSGANHGPDWSKLQTKAKRARKALTPWHYQEIFKQGLLGLKVLHENAVIHCDIKPENLMLRTMDFDKPEVVIIDLGLSKACMRVDAEACGTPGYIPPETYAHGKWFPRGDIFSYGTTMYALLANWVMGIPQQDGDWASVFLQGCSSFPDIVKRTSTFHPDFSKIRPRIPEFEALIAACISKRDLDRPRAPQALAYPLFQLTAGALSEKEDFANRPTSLWCCCSRS